MLTVTNFEMLHQSNTISEEICNEDQENNPFTEEISYVDCLPEEISVVACDEVIEKDKQDLFSKIIRDDDSDCEIVFTVEAHGPVSERRNLVFTKEERDIIINNGKLSDESINMAQYLAIEAGIQKDR